MTLILVHQDWNYISVAFRNLDPKFKFFSDIGGHFIAISRSFQAILIPSIGPRITMS